MKNSFKIAIFYIVLIGILIVATASLWNSVPTDSLLYSQVVDLFKNEQVREFKVDEDNTLTMNVRVTNKDGTEGEATLTYQLSDIDMFREDLGELIEAQHEAGIITAYDYPPPYEIPWWLSLLPYIVVIVLFIAMWIYVMNQANGGKGSKINSVGRAKAKLITADTARVYFKDVAGADEEKAELEEIVEFLRNPEYFTKLGAKIPHGVLLVGPPGTGKTLIAKAVAGEAGVPFYSISGSDFVEMYVGVGASRVRDLFDTAKKNPAAIIFIDEIDAVGRHRGAGLGGGHDEREQTLNQILVEMDGFGSSEGVIVMAATNRPDILDPALLRPGRFDRQITMNPPDVKGREDILRVHSRNKPFEADVDLSVIAKTTVGFTGAELANLLNEAALLAARKGKHLIGMNDLEEAMIKVIVGPAKKSHVITEAERRLTAYHEAGHAITTWVRQKDDPVHQISIIPSGRAGGYTLSFPKEDRSYMSRSAMEDEIVTLLGGRVSEMLILGDISTGASNDIQRATSIARQMVTKYGMSDTLGPILYGSESSSDEIFLGRDFNQTRNYSEETASLIDSEIKRIVTKAYKEAESILRENMDRLHFVAAYLIKNEIMEEAQFVRAMTEPDVTLDELEAMVAEKRRKSKEENEAHARRIREEEAKREAQRQKNEAHDKRSIFPIEHSDPKDPPQSPDNTNE
ncbi:MAG: ATP-dependent zinc metalloprotease FtsH [Eubacteriales bacterium]|nr:ATP-dependent zinc metalloprotease FtsH [Clostridiales bacterium]MDD7773429.1 ATP-dependent zinc metalloprotease FtsH [Eubacteriales bacterium]MDY3942058.1 ATP-dependent zinc metalloprotease FtsH [Eubacteriales bacterium]